MCDSAPLNWGLFLIKFIERIYYNLDTVFTFTCPGYFVSCWKKCELLWNKYTTGDLYAYYTTVLSWGRTYLFPRHGSLVCWSQRGPVHPPSHSQEKPDWLVAWHVPCTQTFLWQGSQPGRIPTCSGTFLKSWSSLLIYRLRMQPWKLVPFCPGDWRKAAMLFFTGMPRKLIIANNQCNLWYNFLYNFLYFLNILKEIFFPN